MIIQFILVSILLATIFFGVLRKSKAPLVSLMMMGLSSMGIIVVLFPSLAQHVADVVGVARGVDVIIYIFIAVMMIVLLDIYIRWQASLEMLTQVVRHISLSEAALREQQRNLHGDS